MTNSRNKTPESQLTFEELALFKRLVATSSTPIEGDPKDYLLAPCDCTECLCHEEDTCV